MNTRVYPPTFCAQRNMPKLCVEKRMMESRKLTVRLGWPDERKIDYYPLDFDGEQPPTEWIHGVTEDRICRYYFERTKDRNPRTVQYIYQWLRENLGWTVRERYWR